MKIRILAAMAGLVLFPSSAFANTQNIGTISMYLCDGGLDLCSNSLSSSPVFLSAGSFTEDFVFDFVNGFPDVPDNVPLLTATAIFDTANGADFNYSTVELYNSFGVSQGFNFGFAPNGGEYRGLAETLIHPGDGYYVEVRGYSNVYGLPLEVSVNAFDLGPVDVPEPSTWAMMWLGAAGFALAARQRRRRSRTPLIFDREAVTRGM